MCSESPTRMTTSNAAQHAASFDSAAELYERARPSYPAEAVDWLLPGNPREVLDLGAGTGKFSRLFSDRVSRLVAVDPSVRMLDQLSLMLPSAETVVASAENLPLPDDSFDAAVCAQAWHWVEATTAAHELARVLRPGGTVGIVWNSRDDRVDWVARMAEIINEASPEGILAHPPTLPEPFGATEFLELDWQCALTRPELRALVASRSHFIIQDAAEQHRVLAALDAMLDAHPQTAGLEQIPVPYRTLCFRVTLAATAV